MANVLAVKFRKGRKIPIPTYKNILHNVGLVKAEYWLKDIDARESIIASKLYTNKSDVIKDWSKWVAECELKYLRNPTKKRKLRSDAIRLEEGIIIIGSDVEVDDHSLSKIIKEFCKSFQQKNKTIIRHVAFHNHEGHVLDNNRLKINKHVHFIFDNINIDGEVIRRNWKKSYLSDIQTSIYEIAKKYIPNLKKVEKQQYMDLEVIDKTTKKPKIISVGKKKGKTHVEYRNMKIQEKLELENTQLKDENANLEDSNLRLQEKVFHPTLKLNNGNKATYQQVCDFNEKKHKEKIQLLENKRKEDEILIDKLKTEMAELIKEIKNNKTIFHNENVAINKNDSNGINMEDEDYDIGMTP